MDPLTKKTLETSRGFTYTYYVHPGDSNKPTVVMQHGFPDNAHLWHEVIPSLIPTGYPLLVPDLLGYDGTSKPLEPAAYNSQGMAADLMELCDAEGARRIISLGHDWGSYLAQRLHLWHPERVAGVVLLNVAYRPPDRENRVDLQAVLRMQEQLTGSPLWAYWELFTAPDGAELLDKRLDCFYTAMHGDLPNWMHQLWCYRGAMRKYLEDNEPVPLKPYAQRGVWRHNFIDRMQRDGITAPLNWYKALATNVHFEVEKNIPPERDVMDKPVLFLGCTDDAVCRTALINFPKDNGFLPHLTIKEIESAHWCPMEKPEEVGSIIAEFLQNTKF